MANLLQADLDVQSIQTSANPPKKQASCRLCLAARQIADTSSSRCTNNIHYLDVEFLKRRK